MSTVVCKARNWSHGNLHSPAAHVPFAQWGYDDWSFAGVALNIVLGILGSCCCWWWWWWWCCCCCCGCCGCCCILIHCSCLTVSSFLVWSRQKGQIMSNDEEHHLPYQGIQWHICCSSDFVVGWIGWPFNVGKCWILNPSTVALNSNSNLHGQVARCSGHVSALLRESLEPSHSGLETRPKAGSASQVHASQTHCQPLDWWTFTVSTFDKLVNKTWIRKRKYFKMVTSILLTQLLSPGGNGGIEPSTAPRHVVRGTIGSTSWQGFWGSIWRKSWWCTLDASRNSCRHWFWTEKLQCRVLGSEHLKEIWFKEAKYLNEVQLGHA